jgi:O-antigen/teichoic acid export membrane protein
MIAFLIMLVSARKRDRVTQQPYRDAIEFHNVQPQCTTKTALRSKQGTPLIPLDSQRVTVQVDALTGPSAGGAEPGDHGLKRIFKNTAWLLAGKGFGGILSLVYIAILTRTLGVIGWGQFALITGAASAVITIVSFQTWQVILRYGPNFLKAGGDRDAFTRLIGLCAVFDLFGALAGCAIILMIAGFAGPYFGWNADMTWSASAFAITMLLSLKSTPTGIMRAFNRFDLGTYAEAVIPLMRLTGVLAAWIWAPTIGYFLLAWAAAEVVHSVVYWIMAIQQVGADFRLSQAVRLRKAFNENAGIGGFLAITNVGSTLNGFANNSAVLVVGFFAGPAAAGLFRLASQISTAMTKISTLLSRAIFSEVNQVRVLHGDDALRALFKQTSRFLLIAGAIIIGAVILLGKPILLLMSGPEFLGAYPLLIILAAAACIDLAGAIYEPVLLSGDAARSTLPLNAFSVLGFVILLAILLPRYGVEGAAWSMLISAIIKLLLFGYAARRHLTEQVNSSS